MDTSADKFDAVREEITQSVGNAQNKVKNLREISSEVKDDFSEMQTEFSVFQNSVNEITGYM